MHLERAWQEPAAAAAAAAAPTEQESVVWPARNTDSIYSLALLSNKLLAVGHDSGFITIHDVENGSVLREFKGHEGLVHTLVVMPDAGFVASASYYDKTVRIWNVSSGTCVAELEHSHALRKDSVVVLTDGTLATTDGTSGIVKFWDWKTATIMKRLFHEDYVFCVCPLTSGGVAVGHGYNGLMSLWSRDGVQTGTLGGQEGVTVRSLIQLPDGRLAAGCSGYRIRLWNIATAVVPPEGKEGVCANPPLTTRILPARSAWLTGAGFDQDKASLPIMECDSVLVSRAEKSDTLVSVLDTPFMMSVGVGRVDAWDTERYAERHEADGSLYLYDTVHAIAVLDGGAKIIVGGYDGRVRIMTLNIHRK